MTARDDKPTAYEEIDHPPHYGGGADDPYEVIKVIDAWQLGFGTGNAVKYIARAGRKPGSDPVKDLRKALWYLTHELRRLGHDPAARREPTPAEAAPFPLNRPVEWEAPPGQRWRGRYVGPARDGRAYVKPDGPGPVYVVPAADLRPIPTEAEAAPADRSPSSPPPGTGLVLSMDVKWVTPAGRMACGRLIGLDAANDRAVVWPAGGGEAAQLAASGLRPVWLTNGLESGRVVEVRVGPNWVPAVLLGEVRGCPHLYRVLEGPLEYEAPASDIRPAPPAAEPESVQAGQTWRHSVSGRLHRVLGRKTRAADGATLIETVPLASDDSGGPEPFGPAWSRPLAEFLAQFAPEPERR